MHKHDGLSATHEMYLKIIYQLRESGDPARVGQMAKGLGVHPSTVSAVVGTLGKIGLVTHDRYGVVKLTEIGEKLAVCVVNRFEILRLFFSDVLGLDSETAEIEACEVEHAVSPTLVNRLEQLTRTLQQNGYDLKLTPMPTSPQPLCGDCIEAGECTVAQKRFRDRFSLLDTSLNQTQPMFR